MTALHWAARGAMRFAVHEILKLNPEAAKVTSYPHRSPGGWTPLMSLLEGNWKTLGDAAFLEIIPDLVGAMDLPSLGARNTPAGNTAFHLACTRGNVKGLTKVLEAVRDRFGLEEPI